MNELKLKYYLERKDSHYALSKTGKWVEPFIKIVEPNLLKFFSSKKDANKFLRNKKYRKTNIEPIILKED